jgi:putative nucleotidyltransferase with HDIG domain
MPDRAHALALLHEWVENEGLRKHMLAVEAAVRSYARERGADEETWGMAGLLHDLDWERYPEEHPLKAVEALREAGYP